MTAFAFIFSLNQYSGTGSNRHCRFGQQDFKSCVSTNSTTRVDENNILNIPILWN